jgi:DNA-binding GntR family transcriptional regulator
MRNYNDFLYRVTLRVLKKETNRMVTSITDHRGIFQSLKEGDVEKSRELVKKHLLYGKRILTL